MFLISDIQGRKPIIFLRCHRHVFGGAGPGSRAECFMGHSLELQCLVGGPFESLVQQQQAAPIVGSLLIPSLLNTAAAAPEHEGLDRPFEYDDQKTEDKCYHEAEHAERGVGGAFYFLCPRVRNFESRTVSCDFACAGLAIMPQSPKGVKGLAYLAFTDMRGKFVWRFLKVLLYAGIRWSCRLFDGKPLQLSH